MSIEDSDDATEGATSYTDAFLDSAVAKIDATFGKGFAKDNPALVGAYLQASATNLSAFMQASMALQSGPLSEMLGAEGLSFFDDEFDDADPMPPKKRKQ